MHMHIHIVRASPLPPDPKPEDPGPGACCQLLGLPRMPKEPPGGSRRQPRKHQETPEETPGAAGGARRVPRCPKPR